MSRIIVLLLILLSLPLAANAQLKTANQYVIATVDYGSGWLSVYVPDPKGGPDIPISYPDKSFISVQVAGKVYSNNDLTVAPHKPDVLLNNGFVTKNFDTVETVWKEIGFDIVQDVYPVSFNASGQIVYSVKIVNHTGTPFVGQAQCLIDVSPNSNDGGRLVTPYDYTANWTQYPNAQNGIPWLFMGFERPPTADTQGVIGTGYINDTIAPVPLGLAQPSSFDIVDWVNASDYAWGLPATAPWGSAYLNNAVLLQWPALAINGGVNDTIREIARGCYGTGEYNVCNGNFTCYTFYPHQVIFDMKKQKYINSPFIVESLIFNASMNASATQVFAHQRTGNPLIIAAPLPVDSNGLFDSQPIGNLHTATTGGVIAPLDMAEVHWLDSTKHFPSPMIDQTNIGISVTASGPFTPDFVGGCAMPVIVQSTVDTVKSGFPKLTVISRTGSFDGSLCNARCIVAEAIDTRACATCGVNALKEKQLQNMTFAILDSSAWKFSVCVIDSMQNGSVTVVALDGTGETDTEVYTYCTIADKLPPIVRPGFKVDTAIGWAVEIDELRPWDRGLDTIIVKSLTGVKIDATRPADMNVHGLSHGWISLVPDGVVPTKLICLEAKDLAGNTIDTCLTFGPASVPAIEGTTFFSCEVYPNPTSGNVTIALIGAEEANVEVLDVLGRSVGAFSMGQSFEWDGSKLGKGTYIVRVTAGRETVSKRIVRR